MSLPLQTVMRFSCVLRKLLRKLKKNIRPLNGRPYISKILIKLPKTLFPSFRVIISPVIVDNNRKTLNYFSEDSLDRSFSTEFYDSLSSSEEEGRIVPLKFVHKSRKNATASSRKCCRHCQRLYYPEDSVMNSSFEVRFSIETPRKNTPKLLKEEFETRGTDLNIQNTLKGPENCGKSIPSPQSYSTPIKLWSDEVEREFEIAGTDVCIPSPPPMPVYDFLNPEDDEFFSKTPLRAVTVGDIQSVKLRPPKVTLTLPKTPEVHDMMAVLRKRFAAMHSPLFGDVAEISSDSEEDLSDFYSDFSNITWRNQNKYEIGVA